MKGKLILGSTHLGNEKFIPNIMKDIIQSSHCIYVDDENGFNQILNYFEINSVQHIVTNRFKPDVEFVNRFSSEVIRLIKSGNKVLIISNNGQTGIGDWYSVLAKNCIKEGCDVEIIPGPSVVNIAYLKSGLDSNNFSFENKLNEPWEVNLEYINQLVRQNKMSIFLEPTNGIKYFFENALKYWGPSRKASIMSNLTLDNESFWTGTIKELHDRISTGEINPELHSSVIAIDGAEIGKR